MSTDPHVPHVPHAGAGAQRSAATTRVLPSQVRYTQTLSTSSVKLGVEFVENDANNPAVMEHYHRLLEELKAQRIRGSMRVMLR